MRLSILAVGSFCIALGVGAAGCDDDDDTIDQGVSTGGTTGTAGTGGIGGTAGTGGAGGSTAGTGGAGGSTAGTGGAGGSTGGAGGSTAGTGGTGGTTVTYAQVQPIFVAKCTPCHSAGGIGASHHTLSDSNADARKAAEEAICAGKMIGECSLIMVQSGEMPLGKGCTGNPAQDASNPACLTQAEQDLLAAWIAGGLM
jgi:hypothetical protein